MTTPSNLYAEKVYSEQPLALWALDDKSDYISLISELQRNIQDEWIATGCTVTTSTSSLNQPFLTSYMAMIEGDVPAGNIKTVSLVSDNIINFSNLSQELKTFSVGSYFYSDSAYLSSVSIGYEYTDTTTSQIIQNLKTFNTSVFQFWSFVSETFTIPEENTDLRLVIQFTYTDGGASSSDYVFYLNGITFGQWSEDFNAYSLGVTPISLPSNIALSTSQCIPSDPYGLGGDVGYYLVDSNSLKARNTGLPMVYGGSNITRLRPNSENLQEPSLIVPGYGFLNKDGQYKEYTVEFWIRINSSAYEARKIFGPIGSSDGLYVESGFLTLVIGKQFSSYFVGEWFRPMLIHVRVIRNSATVLLNGEEIINLNIMTSSLTLPEKLNEYGDDQDWLGFYSYQDITPIEIDCIAIYPYSVANNVAKRRWVYGQGVLSPEGINSGYGGTSAFIDYPFSDYTNNYIYPDIGTWEQGTFDNLNATGLFLSTPQYSLPDIVLNTKTLDDLYEDNLLEQNSLDYRFITFRPNSSWNSDNCYFNFNKFNILGSPISALYGVFSSDNLLTTEILFKIYSSITGNYFIIYKDLDEIVYSINYNGNNQEIYRTDIIVEDEKFAVGVNVSTISQKFGGYVSAFFGNQNGLNIYIAGDNIGDRQFTGKIYSVGLCTSYNYDKIKNNFDSDGFVILDSYLATGSEESLNAIELLQHTASYTLLPTEAYGTYFLDIGVAGSWEDYLPLSYFGQYVTNDVGNTYYDLDFLQFNINYPKPASVSEVEQTTTWTYNELKAEYSSSPVKPYADLDNKLLTGWDDYQDMSENAISFYQYDTQDASIRSYISIQYIKDGANAPESYFANIEPASLSSVINVSDFPNWESTKFEVVDNTIIYPGVGIDFNKMALVYHLDFNIRGILSKPINLKKLEITSQALSNSSATPVGTRFGSNLFPYTRSGFYYDYKAKNPFSIYKGSTPYLYLTRTSGIEVRGDYSPLIDRGISMPINSNLSNNYRISAIQLWMRCDNDEFPGDSVKLFEIDYKGDTIEFYMQPNSDSADRATVYAINKSTGLPSNGISYYWNGAIVREPVITVKEWGVLGVAFSTSLVFDSYLGSLNLNGPIVFNNIAYYQANSLQQVQSTINRPWARVKEDGLSQYEWVYWLNNYTWEGVLIISASELYGVNPSDVYKSYVGTNKIIIDDDEGLMVDADKIKVYSQTTWTIRVGTPV